MHGAGDFDSIKGAWVGAVSDVSADDQALARALEPPHAVLGLRARQGEEIISSAIRYIADLPDDVDWSSLATSILDGLAGSRMAAANHTPPGLAALLVALLEPIEGCVYDPACGVGALLAAARQKSDGAPVRLVGQEVAVSAWRLAYLRLLLSRANYSLETGDTLLDDRFPGLRADRILVDPPVSVQRNVQVDPRDARWMFGVPHREESWLWVQHAIAHLGDGGKAVAIVPTGLLHRRGDGLRVRRAAVESGSIRAVIELGPGLLAGTRIPVAVLLLGRGPSTELLFVDGRQLGESVRGGSVEFSDGEIQRVVSTIRAWEEGRHVDEPMFSAEVPVGAILDEEIADLSPSRYVQYVSDVSTMHGEPFAERLTRLDGAWGLGAKRLRSAFEEVQAAWRRLEVLEEQEDWPAVRLEDLLATEPVNGSRLEEDGDGQGTLMVLTEEVGQGVTRIMDPPPTVTYGKLRGRVTEAGDLLLVTRGITEDRPSRCAHVLVDQPLAFSESLTRLRPLTEVVDPDYLRLALTSRQGRDALAAHSTGAVIRSIRPSRLKEVEVRLPPLAIQRQLAQSVCETERLLSELSEQLRVGVEAAETLREALAAGMLLPRNEAQGSRSANTESKVL
jgi:hypothetical protein